MQMLDDPIRADEARETLNDIRADWYGEDYRDWMDW